MISYSLSTPYGLVFEIKLALDYAYRMNVEERVLLLISTQLPWGFDLSDYIRLQGYPLCSDVLEPFKDQEGQFVCSFLQTGEIRSVLNRFRASLVAFPSEKVMAEPEIFSTIYLKEALQKVLVSSLSRQDFHDAIYMNAMKLLDLTKLDFNIYNSQS